jgi:CBS-domain-containing membrane protein
MRGATTASDFPAVGEARCTPSRVVVGPLGAASILIGGVPNGALAYLVSATQIATVLALFCHHSGTRTQHPLLTYGRKRRVDTARVMTESMK